MSGQNKLENVSVLATQSNKLPIKTNTDQHTNISPDYWLTSLLRGPFDLDVLSKFRCCCKYSFPLSRSERRKVRGKNSRSSRLKQIKVQAHLECPEERPPQGSYTHYVTRLRGEKGWRSVIWKNWGPGSALSNSRVLNIMLGFIVNFIFMNWFGICYYLLRIVVVISWVNY